MVIDECGIEITKESANSVGRETGRLLFIVSCLDGDVMVTKGSVMDTIIGDCARMVVVVFFNRLCFR